MTNASLDLPDAGKVKDKMIMNFQLETALAANTGQIRFEFPPSITLNAINAVPVCKYEPNGGAEQLFSACSIDTQFSSILATVGASALPSGVVHKVKFQEYDFYQYSSSIADTFEFCLQTSTSYLGTDLDNVCAVGNIPPENLSTARITPDCKGNDIYSVYTMEIKPNLTVNPINGVNPEIRIKLPTRDTTNA